MQVTVETRCELGSVSPFAWDKKVQYFSTKSKLLQGWFFYNISVKVKN